MGLLAPEPDKTLLCSWDGTGLASRKGTLPVHASRVFPCKLGGPAPAPSSCLPPPTPPPQPCHRGLVAADVAPGEGEACFGKGSPSLQMPAAISLAKTKSAGCSWKDAGKVFWAARPPGEPVPDPAAE